MTTSAVVRYFRLLRLLKLVRLAKLSKFLSMFEDEGRISPPTVSLIQTSLAIAFMGHMMACAWYMVGDFALHDQLSSGSTLTDAQAWITSSLNVTEMTPPEQYVASLYWSFTTMTTLGYGDITPQNTAERIFAMCCMLFGAIVFGYVIGSLSSLSEASHVEDLEKAAIRGDVKEFCKSHRLTPELNWKIRKLINYQLDQRSVFDEQSILDSLPAGLKNQVVGAIVKDSLSKFSFFRDKPTEFIAELLLSLTPLVYVASEVVFEHGATSTEIIFLLTGQMKTEVDGNPLIVLREGSVIGDVGVLLALKRTACVTAATTCETLSLSSTQIHDVSCLLNILLLLS
jgi:hypothetical protein